MVLYNISTVANSTGIYDFMYNVNKELMGHWFGVTILITISVILLIAFLQTTNNAPKALTAASFIAFGLSLVMRALGFVPDLAVFVTIAIAGLCVAFIIGKSRD